MDFWLQLRNQAPEQWIKISNFAKAEESKIRWQCSLVWGASFTASSYHMWQDKSWLFNYDKAPTHSVLIIQQFLKNNLQFTWFCSTGLFSSQAQWIIKWTYFVGMEATKKTLTMELRGIPEESFQQHIETWLSILDSRGITSKGETILFVVRN